MTENATNAAIKEQKPLKKLGRRNRKIALGAQPKIVFELLCDLYPLYCIGTKVG